MSKSAVTGDDKVILNLKKKSKMDRVKLKAVITLGTDKIFKESQKQVPVDQGLLKASGTQAVYEKQNEIFGEVKYTQVYAAAVHENPRSGKTEGISPKGQLYRSWASRGKWKYLEDPFKKYYNRIMDMIKKAV